MISKIKIKHIEGVMVDCQIYSLGPGKYTLHLFPGKYTLHWFPGKYTLHLFSLSKIVNANFFDIQTSVHTVHI